jgi:RHS repeat-associated protein
MNRLSTASDSGGWSRLFNYDAFGNHWVTTPESNTLTVDPQTPTMNVFNSNTNQTNAVSYDGAGNQIAIGPYSAWYDAENRITQVYDNVLKTQTNYVYDGEGHRVAKVTPQNTTIYAYDAFGRLATEDTSYRPPTPLCQICYLGWDYLGSTRLVTDESGQVVSRHDYLPFGEDPATNGTASQAGRTTPDWSAVDDVRMRFTGQERDDTGLDFFQARYYSAPLGRFTSPDPENAGVDLTDPQSWNGYAYVGNRPLTDTDPSGLQNCSGSCVSYNPVPGSLSGGGSDTGVGGGFGFTLWESIPTPPKVITLTNPKINYSQVPAPAQGSNGWLNRLRDFVEQGGQIACDANPLLCIGRGGLIEPSLEEAAELQRLTDLYQQAQQREGSFSIRDWSSYPASVPRPQGPFRLLEGAEYENARASANAMNRAMRDQLGLRGRKFEIHEIHPVKFGGDPVSLTNKILLPEQIHRQQVTPWWNQFLKYLTSNW